MITTNRSTVKSFLFDSGERYCLLVEKGTQKPLFFENLFVTTQARNRSLSFSTMRSSLACLAVFRSFMDSIGESATERFRARRFLEPSELDALRDHCQTRVPPKNGIVELTRRPVARSTLYARLSAIASYVEWLAFSVLSTDIDREGIGEIEKMVRGVRARRPRSGRRDVGVRKREISDIQIRLLIAAFDPAGTANPFKQPDVRQRNWSMFLLLYHLGVRAGELLNIRIRDIDFQKNQLIVARRADELDDPRVDQPLVKTLDRRLPLSNALAKNIHSYVIGARKNVSNSDRHDYLFVTHKRGPTEGHAVSKSTLNKLFARVRRTDVELEGLSPHWLRHDWNHRFSCEVDSRSGEVSPEEEEKIRSYVMGWREGSGSSATYNRRHVERKAQIAALRLQEIGMNRLGCVD